MNVEKSTDVSKKQGNVSTAKKNRNEEKNSLAFEIVNKDTETEVKSEMDPAISEVKDEVVTRTDIYSKENMAETLLSSSKAQMSQTSINSENDVRDGTGGM